MNLSEYIKALQRIERIHGGHLRVMQDPYKYSSTSNGKERNDPKKPRGITLFMSWIYVTGPSVKIVTGGPTNKDNQVVVRL